MYVCKSMFFSIIFLFLLWQIYFAVMRFVTFEFLTSFSSRFNNFLSLSSSRVTINSQQHALRPKEFQVNVFRCISVRMCWHNFKVHCRRRPHTICEVCSANRVRASFRTSVVSSKISSNRKHAVEHGRHRPDWRHSIEEIRAQETSYLRTACAASHRCRSESLAVTIRNSTITRGWPFWSIKVVRKYSFLLSLSYLCLLCFVRRYLLV